MFYENKRMKYFKLDGYICPRGYPENPISLKATINATLALITTLRMAGNFNYF